MALQNITGAEFEELVAKGTVLVDFWAPWCGPCRNFGPIFEAAAAKYPEITFAKVNTDENQQFAGSLGIQSIPTLMAFRDGICLFNQAGALPAKALDEVIAAVQAADMEEVRQKLASE